ncbi:NAD-dependent succinate-semialdehyde dehydrogenase [Kaistia dalseonensis]|uniref:Succinate-semialdehyde dehydrogenase/glutarate-semialdehyde dehydrogenase n=1 Tax=Kaistia dalseonensis TaxID=410840 RepID=A0ABU0H7C3_9HYPH|nr:NAD-dependent succinate-semialdehyde dehydrogenase [Kaistia dalseonensis]MCX5495604.1 NAD-dependent succinate-semialdehyde dehydrogenase [Kaistia dalseonensis]MDQ0438197.1 succinate-semialdehyde dehydrogenase/glutarate-semialdehyde dehydrogenase [Kaistia dalseonensis]
MTEHLELLRRDAFIDGAWIGAPKRFAVTNPADGAIIAEVADLEVEQVREAIAAAQRALPAWRARSGKQRSRILRVWYELIMDNQEALARLLSAEQGKPLAESRGEIAYGASFIEWFAEEAKRVYGDVIPATTPDKRIVVIRQPVGVVAAITPWNFPHAMITRKAGPALAVGCTMVLKPASATPLSALALAALAERAGVPAGVFNVVTSSRTAAVGTELSTSPAVAKLTFTGSTPVGKILLKQAADTVKRTSMELGGNAPFIVFDDADLDRAVEGAIASKFRNTGQTCVCSNRILVQAGVYDAFADRLAAAVRQLRVGSALGGDSDQGPLIDGKAASKVEEHIADAIGKGARIVTGGKRHALGGTFFEPTVLADATPAMMLAQEETFGPVAPLFRFETEDEAVALANNTEVGLAGYFYTENVSRAWRVAEALEVGMVGINEGLISTEVAPFGGVKESGQGREGSKYGLDDYLELKYICFGAGRDTR